MVEVSGRCVNHLPVLRALQNHAPARRRRRSASDPEATRRGIQPSGSASGTATRGVASARQDANFGGRYPPNLLRVPADEGLVIHEDPWSNAGDPGPTSALRLG